MNLCYVVSEHLILTAERRKCTESTGSDVYADKYLSISGA
jgi:hypothetical protein